MLVPISSLIATSQLNVDIFNHFLMNKINSVWYNIKCSTGEKVAVHLKAYWVVRRRRNDDDAWKAVVGCNFPIYNTIVALVVDTYR
jgi:hypothetical protein